MTRLSDASDGADGAPPAVALVGPTASGKTEVGVLLAEALGTAVLGCDSRQIYRGLAVGTAQPSAEQLRRVSHHLVGFLDPDERFSAGRYREAVLALLPAIRAAGRTPLFVGGTGLYLRAALEGLCAVPQAAPDLRRWLGALAAGLSGGLRPLVARVDPGAAARIHPNDRYRLARALEVYLLGGAPLTERQRTHRAAGPAPRARLFAIEIPPEELRRRIRQRLDAMIASGFLQEVRRLLEERRDPSLPALRAVGYPQLIAHARGEESLAGAVEATCRATWQYARRQLLWFRADPTVTWIPGGRGRGPEAIAAEILERIGHAEAGA